MPPVRSIISGEKLATNFTNYTKTGCDQKIRVSSRSPPGGVDLVSGPVNRLNHGALRFGRPPGVVLHIAVT